MPVDSMQPPKKITSVQQYQALKKKLHNIVTSTVVPADEFALYKELETQLKKIELENNNEDKKLAQAIQAIKKFIADLERQEQDFVLLKSFKDNGLYRMLYRNARIQGIDDDSGLKTGLKLGYIGVGVSALFIALFIATSFVAAPVWLGILSTALFAASVTFLSTLVYGVVNDLFATKATLPYFLLGHQKQQHSLIRTNDPVAQGIAWGVAATSVLGLIAGVAFGVATAITAAFVPVAVFVFPLIFVAMPLIAWGADRLAKRKAKQYAEVGYEEQGITYKIDDWGLGSNEYQKQGLELMNPDVKDKAAWLATGKDRNGFGFTKVPLIGVGVLASLITLSAVHSFLPVVLFSSAIATVLPIAAAAAAVLFLVGTGVYMYANRNKQIDNQFKLEFDKQPALTDELYFAEEDLSLIDQLDKTASSQATATSTLAQEIPKHFPPLFDTSVKVVGSATLQPVVDNEASPQLGAR